MDANTTPVPPQPPAPPPSPAAWPSASRAPDDRLWVAAVALAAVPLLLVLFLAIVAPGFLAPLSDRSVSIAGIPPSVIFAVVLVGMVFASGLLAASVRPSAIGLVVAVIWMPIGLFLVIFGPAIVLITKGLSET